jgi:hypothetical protein
VRTACTNAIAASVAVTTGGTLNIGSRRETKKPSGAGHR